MQLTATQKVSFVVFLACVILLTFAWTETSQKEFETELKRAASSNVEYLMLCELRSRVTADPCLTIDGATKLSLSAALKHLSEATAKFPPGHPTVETEKMLRIGQGGPASKQYIGCYRVTKYVGFDDIYITRITTDRECTRVEKEHAGYAAIPRHGLGNGAI